MTPRDAHIRRLLHAIQAEPQLSQRSLAARLGIALGLTNLLLRRLAAKGWIRVVRVRPNHMRYLLTPAGLAQKARMSRDYFQDTVRFYTEARDRVQDRFAEMQTQANGDGCRNIVFYGAGEVAEVGYVCVQRTTLRLVGVVDDERAGWEFFGMAVRSSVCLSADRFDGVPYDRLVVMSFGDHDRIRASLDGAAVPIERVFWV